jgi:FkbM family methyltransferase
MRRALTAIGRLWRIARLSTTPWRAFAALLASRAGFAGSACTWYSIGGVRLLARPVDQFGLEEVWIAEEYGILKAWLRTRSSPLVIDIGANVGAFSAWVLALADAEVHSIEPSPDTAALLARTVRENPGRRWSVHQCAVWDADAHVPFPSVGLSTGRRVAAAGVSVPARRLGSLLQELAPPPVSIALMKMDIEGAEERVLRTPNGALERVECLVVEIHPDHSSEMAVRQSLQRTFPLVCRLERRTSRKPMYLAARGSAAGVFSALE